MPCLLGCLALVAPRFTIVLLVIFSDYIGTAFNSLLWPILGFFFFPTATLAYTWAIHAQGGLEGIHLAIFVIAILIDVGLVGSGARCGKWRRWED